MRIMVLDVAAVSGGALTILKNYYHRALKDIENEYIFILSTPNLEETKNILIRNLKWVKRTRFHRIYFDRFSINKLINKYMPDKIISLQNLVIFRSNIPQEIFGINNVIPFAEYKFSLFKHPNLWFYQNIYKKMLIKSLVIARKITVNSDWLFEMITNTLNIPKEKVIVERFEIDKINNSSYNGNNRRFIYPASAEVYKNHKIIIEALMILSSSGISNYEVFFTLKGDENPAMRKLFKLVKKHNLPVNFVGELNSIDLHKLYQECILVYTSLIESGALPIVEAINYNCPIISVYKIYSIELLKDYDLKQFFKDNDVIELSKLIGNFLS